MNRGRRAKYIIWINAPHFCAGVIVASESVIEVANILWYMKDWRVSQVYQYCKKKKWVCQEVR